MKFKSKIGFWYHLFMLAIVACCVSLIWSGIWDDDRTSLIVGLVISLLFIPFFFSIYLNTYYTLEEKTLHIRCGLYMNKRIEYRDIHTIYETRDPMASVALSLDRISINFTNMNGKSDELYISPKNKQEFIKLLKERMV